MFCFARIRYRLIHVKSIKKYSPFRDSFVFVTPLRKCKQNSYMIGLAFAFDWLRHRPSSAVNCQPWENFISFYNTQWFDGKANKKKSCVWSRGIFRYQWVVLRIVHCLVSMLKKLRQVVCGVTLQWSRGVHMNPKEYYVAAVSWLKIWKIQNLVSPC